MVQKIKDLVKYASFAIPVMAADISLLPTDANWTNLGTLTVGRIITGLVSLVLIVVAVVFFFILIAGGLKWVMSEGDQKAVESARSQITNALIGLAIVFAAFAVIRLIESLFGVTILDAGFTFKPF
jgi:hypothetical protein